MPQYVAIVDEKGIAHYGVKGMKWGVRKDRSRAKRIDKLNRRISKTNNDRKKQRLTNERDYLQELRKPGSTKTLSKRYLSKKRIINNAVTIGAGLAAVSNAYSAGMGAIVLNSVAATNAAILGQSAVAAMSLTGVGVPLIVGAGAGKIAYDAHKRSKTAKLAAKTDRPNK